MNLISILFCSFLVAEGFGAKNSGLCPPIPFPHGRIRYRQRGKIARFLCNTGFMLAGDRYSVCVGGKWDNVGSKCVRASCKDGRQLPNGLVYPSNGGAVLNFYCKSGFHLHGANVTYCDGVKWDNPLPSCLPSNSPPPLSCDFEKEDICGWNHDLNHDFDWTRLNFRTPSWSIGTGPSYDHTKGKDQDGYYMYIESSARNVNDTARLISPVYEKTNDTTCFEFYYHMYGATTGSLRVYLKKTNQNWNLAPGNALFVKIGNQGNRWHRGFVVLDSDDSDFQIVIEGVRGSSYVSDIAIDDVRIIEKCNPDEEMAEQETTTEEYATTESTTVESCENRCDKTDNRTSDWLITCDCDEGCYERNRCCPDYFDYCVTSTTEEPTTEATEEATTLKTTLVPTTLKLKPKPTIKSTVSTTQRITTFTPTTKKTSKITVETKKGKESDVVEITTVATSTEKETPFPVKEVEKVSVGDNDKNFDHQKIEVGTSIVEANTRTIVFAVGVIFGLLFAMVGMAFLAKRYQWCRCQRMRRNQSGSGDSQSDVRFLTGDEVLDFTLASDYDSL